MSETPEQRLERQRQLKTQREAKLNERERKLKENLLRVQKQQLELKRTTEEVEAQRKRQAILLGQALLKRAQSDDAAARLVVDLIDSANKKDQKVLESVRARFSEK